MKLQARVEVMIRDPQKLAYPFIKEM